jgi:hypothetical protein
MRRFFDGESTKRTQLHDFCQVGVDLLQATERVIEREDRDLEFLRVNRKFSALD